MEEKALIKSEKSSIVKRVMIIGLCIIVLAVLLRLVFPSYWVEVWPEHNDGETAPFDMFLESLIIPNESFDFVVCPLIYIGVIAVIYGIIIIIANRNVTLTVTNRRVYGTAKWGKRVDLPLDMISAVATAKLGGIAVSTSSGAIRFLGIKNNLAIHETISKLLMERQEKAPAASEQKPAVIASQSNADELKKFKELLDSGVITQEEFDAKKKQLLGI